MIFSLIIDDEIEIHAHTDLWDAKEFLLKERKFAKDGWDFSILQNLIPPKQPVPYELKIFNSEQEVLDSVSPEQKTHYILLLANAINKYRGLLSSEKNY